MLCIENATACEYLVKIVHNQPLLLPNAKPHCVFYCAEIATMESNYILQAVSISLSTDDFDLFTCLIIILTFLRSVCFFLFISRLQKQEIATTKKNNKCACLAYL